MTISLQPDRWVWRCLRNLKKAIHQPSQLLRGDRVSNGEHKQTDIIPPHVRLRAAALTQRRVGNLDPLTRPSVTVCFPAIGPFVLSQGASRWAVALTLHVLVTVSSHSQRGNDGTCMYQVTYACY